MSEVVYCVDEAGDSVLCNRRGKQLVGTEGCSRYFIMGLIQVAHPGALDRCLKDLRAELLSDPYFRKVPSMQPEHGKTALFFHAKDDPPEARREVFHALLQQDLAFHSVVRDKLAAVRIVRDFRKIDATYRYNQNQLYDDLVRLSTAVIK